MGSKKLGMAAAFVAGALCLTATANAQDAGKPVKGGSLILAIGVDPPTVNPAITSGIPDKQVGCLIYEGMMQATADGRPMPLLAKSWTISPDGKTYSFKLNQAKWHDGKPFTSEDVAYSIKEVSAKYAAVIATAVRLIDRIETPASDEVKIILKEPFGPFLISWSCGEGGVVLPAHIFRGTDVPANPATSATPVGTGAYKIGEWKRGNYIRLVRNPDYWDPNKPYLDEIVVRIMPESTTRMQALQAGEIDYLPGNYFATNDRAAVAANPKLKTALSGFPPASYHLFYNITRKPMDDVRVRRALAMGLDRDYLVKNVWFGDGMPGRMPFTQVMKWAADPNVDYNKMYPYDPAKANALLDEAGLKKGADGTRFTLRLSYSNDAAERNQAAAAIKSMWRAIGVETTIDSNDRATDQKKVFLDRDFDVTIENYTSYGDPALGIARTFVSSSGGKLFGNPTGYANPEVDELFVKGEQATDQAARGEFYKKAQAILARDLPSLNFRDYQTVDAASVKLQGAWEVLGPASLFDAWLAK